jgi:hypothetical protein
LKLEFLDYLKEAEYTRRIKELGDEHSNSFLRDYRQFRPIGIGNIVLSIQASLHHYCTPRETFENPSIYMTMELGIFETPEDGGVPKNVDLLNDERFRGLAKLEEFGENEVIKGIYGYMSVEAINSLFKYCYLLFGSPSGLKILN